MVEPLNDYENTLGLLSTYYKFITNPSTLLQNQSFVPYNLQNLILLYKWALAVSSW